MPTGRSPADLPPLSPDEARRYARHLVLPEIGDERQRRLKDARVLLVGAGGLGSPAALYLAAAGIGTLGVVDFDAVDASNLQRQILHGTKDVGRSKIASARDRLRDLNPHVEVVGIEARLGAANGIEIVRGWDVVVDGTDNFSTRYLVNDACVLLGKPNVHGSVFRFEGQASVFCTEDGPCYRCLHPEPPPPGSVPSCAEGGVLGVLPGLVGLVQATETVKLVTGAGEPLAGRLLLVDALAMEFRTLAIPRDPRCPACGTREIRSLAEHPALCASPRGSEAEVRDLTPAELHARLRRGDDLVLLDVREPHEWNLVRLDGARLVPLASLPGALDTLDPSRETVVYCRSGVRSVTAVRILQAAGFARTWNLAGGILRWGSDVDPSVPRY